MRTLSWSQVSRFSKCARSWELSHLDRLERKPGAEKVALYRGTAFHAGMEAGLRGVFHNVPNPAAVGAGAAWETLKGMTIPNKSFYNWGAGEYQDDIEYYAMIDDMQATIPQIVTYYFEDFMGRDYRVVSLGELGLGSFDEPAVEISFNWELSVDVKVAGLIDAIVFDNVLQQYVIIDWKLRKAFGSNDLALMDGQLQLYAALYNKQDLGVQIEEVVMWQCKAGLPKPAAINKNGSPSIAAQATTPEHWLATLPIGLMSEEKAASVVDELVANGKLRTKQDFVNPVRDVVTPATSELILANIAATAAAMDYTETLLDAGHPAPSMLSSYGCQFCEFLKLCGSALRVGGDASIIIEYDYQTKETRDETEAQSDDD